MALIYCEYCGHEISDNASVCPNCGNVTTKSLNKKRKLAVVIIIILVLISAVAAISIWVEKKKDENNRMKELLEKIQNDTVYSKAEKEQIIDLYKNYASDTEIHVDSFLSAIKDGEPQDVYPDYFSDSRKSISTLTEKLSAVSEEASSSLNTQVKTGRCKATAYDPDDYYVNIRKKGSVHSDIVQSVNNETDIYVRPGTSGWYRVSLGPNNHSIGFMSVKKVAFDSWNIDTYVVTEDSFTTVYPRATTNSKMVKRLSEGSTFQGIRASDASSWIGVLEYDYSIGKDILVGFVEDSKVRMQ